MLIREVVGIGIIIVGILVSAGILKFTHKLILGLPPGIVIIIIGAGIAGWIPFPNLFP